MNPNFASFYVLIDLIKPAVAARVSNKSHYMAIAGAHYTAIARAYFVTHMMNKLNIL